MPLADWIHKYPGVQKLLQQDDEALLYGEESYAVSSRLRLSSSPLLVCAPRLSP